MPSERNHASRGPERLRGILFLIPALVGALLVLSPHRGAHAQAPALVAVDDLVTVEFSGLRFNRRTGTYDTLARVSNNSPRAVFTPLRLVVSGIVPSGVALANPSGTDGGLPYVNIPAPGDSFAPGQRVDNVLLQFRNPSGVRFTFGRSAQGQRLLLRAPVATPAALVPNALTGVEVAVQAYGGPGAVLAALELQAQSPLPGDPDRATLRDDGQGADRVAGDGIYAGTLSLSTNGLGPDQCFLLKARADSEGLASVSPDARLCVTGFPIGTVGAEGTVDVPPVPGAPATAAAANQILAVFREGTPESVIDAAALGVGASVVGTIPALRVHQFGLPAPLSAAQLAGALAALRAHPDVAKAEPNIYLEIAGAPRDTPNDPRLPAATAGAALSSYQWALGKIGAAEAWKVTKAQDRAAGAFVLAVIDTGVDFAHEDLDSTLARLKCLGTPCAADPDPAADPVGHGTAVAGVATALTNNATGIAGASWGARILSIKVATTTTPALLYSDVLNALTRARTEQAKIINMSLGKNVTFDCSGFATVFSDTLLVGAAGNQGSGTLPYFPGDCPGALAVANATAGDRLAIDSNYGSFVDLAAPGTDILTTALRGACPYCDPAADYRAFSGTSMAAPLVAGAATVLLTANESLTPADLIARLRASGAPVTQRETAGGPVALGTAIPRLDLCAALLFNASALPRFDAGAGTIAENSAANTLVGALVPSCDSVTYTLTGTDGGRFQLASAGGGADVRREIRVAAAPPAIDFEAGAARSITVQAQSVHNPALTVTRSLTVTLTNVNEAPAVNAATFSVAENSAAGTAVGTVTATDPDAGDTRSFSIVGGNTGGAFAINPGSGLITVANAAALDFEATPTFALTVRATDAGGAPGQATVTVNLTDVAEGTPFTLFTSRAAFLAAVGATVPLTQDFSSFAAGTDLTGVSFLTGVNVTTNLPPVRVFGGGLFSAVRNGSGATESFYDVNLPGNYNAVGFDVAAFDPATGAGVMRVFFLDGTSTTVSFANTTGSELTPVFFGVIAGQRVVRIRWNEPLETDGVLCCEETVLDNFAVANRP